MEFIQCVLYSVLMILKTVDESYGNCLLSINKDFGQPSPVFLQNGEVLAGIPKSGAISLRPSEALLVACPGNKKYVVFGNDTTDFATVEVHCVKNTTFRAKGWEGAFKEIRCNAPPWFTTQDIGGCHGGNRIYKVGYNIESKFHSVYEACFNAELLNTLYVTHHLSPANKLTQGGGRPNFIEGDLFGKVRMSALYKAANQKSRINALLGDEMAQEYVTKKQFLTRGHLAPKADFTLRGLQRSSFHYVNTAPQWMRGNAGDWAALEDALRRRVSTLNATVTIYTGTDGVLALPNNAGRFTDIYLATDANNNYIVPVPLYFYKLVYNPQKKTATAFISINSSFYNSSTTQQLTFCDDICDNNKDFSWLRWRNDGTHSFCCDYKQFVSKISYLPKLDVRGRFY